MNTPSLRDRVIALGQESRKETGDVFGEWERLALAVAALAVAHERERCAEACLRAVPDRYAVKVIGESAYYVACAAAIRARKEEL